MVEEIKAHLIELELRLQNASRRDMTELTDLISPDFYEFGASGRIWTRELMIEELLAETPYQIHSEDFRYIRLGDSAALLTYVCITAKRTTLRSSIWRQEGDNWRVVFHQGTIIVAANPTS